jgi:hypothetical protein
MSNCGLELLNATQGYDKHPLIVRLHDAPIPSNTLQHVAILRSTPMGSSCGPDK